MKMSNNIKKEKIMNSRTMTIDNPVLSAEVIEIPSSKPNVDVAREVTQVINEKGEVNLSLLSPKQVERCNSLNKSLVVTDINSISNYGADLQHTMTRYSNDFLKAVRGSQGGEVGELINNLLTELDYVDVDEFGRVNLNHLKQLINKDTVLIEPTSGKVLVNGSVGYMFQKDHLFILYQSICKIIIWKILLYMSCINVLLWF